MEIDDIFSNDDLKDLLEEYEEAVKDEEVQDKEIKASEKRYKDIIKKHREE